jgi:hypothetical protein
MPPLIASWPLTELRIELEAIGVFVLEEFPDGDVRLGDRPMVKPFTGKSTIIAAYISLTPGELRYDIFTLRAAIKRVGKEDRLQELESKLFARAARYGDDAAPGTSAGRVN